MPTQVTGTLIDSLGQLWIKAPIQFIFYPTPSTPGPFTINGADFDKMPPIISTDTNGFFSIVLPSNSEISPANSQWQMIVGPDASYQAIVLNLYLQTGALNVSSLFTTSGAVKQVQSLFIPRAYADGEVTVPPNSGQLYYNVSDKVFKYYESGNWAVLGAPSGGGMVYPPPGIAVSTGTSWAASLDPTSVAYTNVNNNFTATQNFGQINVGSELHVAGVSRLANNWLNIGRVGSTATDVPNILTDGTNLILDSSPNGFTYINWLDGQGTLFGNGQGVSVASIDKAGNANFNGNINAASANISGLLNTGSLEVGGSQPAGYILQSNGTTFVPVPFPTASHGVLTATITDYTGATGSRDWGIVILNGPNLRIVSGTGHTNGGTVGSTQGLVGTGSPTTQVWGMTVGATLSQGVIGFNFSVPPNYFYVVQKNTLSQGPGGSNGVTTIANWTEIDVSIV